MLVQLQGTFANFLYNACLSLWEDQSAHVRYRILKWLMQASLTKYTNKKATDTSFPLPLPRPPL